MHVLNRTIGGGKFMPRSDAMNRAIQKYDREKIDRIMFRVPKGKKEIIQEHASCRGESLSAFLNRAIEETIERDNRK